MEFFGLLGEKLGHSMSPIIHKKIFENASLEGAYKLFPIPKGKLQDFASGVKLLDIRGFNVTIPYKEDIMELLDNISKEAEDIGAVNTVMVKENKLYGYNTDYYGFGYTFKIKNVSLKDKIAVVLGAGGASKALLAYLLDNEVSKVYVVSRTPSNVVLNSKDERLSVITYEELKTLKGDILINATPVGMYPNVDNSPVDVEVVKNFEVIMDIIYNPLETKLLRLGREQGKITLDGLYMLVGQAVKAQEIFQGMTFGEELIEKIYEEIKDIY